MVFVSKLRFGFNVLVCLWAFSSAASGILAMAPANSQTPKSTMSRQTTPTTLLPTKFNIVMSTSQRSSTDSSIVTHKNSPTDLETNGSTNSLLITSADIVSDVNSTSVNSSDLSGIPASSNINTSLEFYSKFTRNSSTWLSSTSLNTSEYRLTSSADSDNDSVSSMETAEASTLAPTVTQGILTSLLPTRRQTRILPNPTVIRSGSSEKTYSVTPILTEKRDSSTIPTTSSPNMNTKIRISSISSSIKITQRRTNKEVSSSNVEFIASQYHPGIISASILSGAGAAAFLLAIIYYLHRTFSTSKVRSGQIFFTDVDEINISAPPIQALCSRDIESLCLTDYMEDINADTNSIV